VTGQGLLTKLQFALQGFQFAMMRVLDWLQDTFPNAFKSVAINAGTQTTSNALGISTAAAQAIIDGTDNGGGGGGGGGGSGQTPFSTKPKSVKNIIENTPTTSAGWALARTLQKGSDVVNPLARFREFSSTRGVTARELMRGFTTTRYHSGGTTKHAVQLSEQLAARLGVTRTIFGNAEYARIIADKAPWLINNKMLTRLGIPANSKVGKGIMNMAKNNMGLMGRTAPGRAILGFAKRIGIGVAGTSPFGRGVKGVLAVMDIMAGYNLATWGMDAWDTGANIFGNLGSMHQNIGTQMMNQPGADWQDPQSEVFMRTAEDFAQKNNISFAEATTMILNMQATSREEQAQARREFERMYPGAVFTSGFPETIAGGGEPQ